MTSMPSSSSKRSRAAVLRHSTAAICASASFSVR